MGSEPPSARPARDRDVTDRDRIRREIERVAFGEVELSGRALASRVTALRTLERVTRDKGESEPEPEPGPPDYPVDERGVFDPGLSPDLWSVRLNFRWEAGSDREREAVERWEQRGGRRDWELIGRPFARSDWEQDRGPWLQVATSSASP
jgi:hypothetical protein